MGKAASCLACAGGSFFSSTSTGPKMAPNGSVMAELWGGRGRGGNTQQHANRAEKARSGCVRDCRAAFKRGDLQTQWQCEGGAVGWEGGRG
jgi:hypothetical protein